MEKIHLLEPSVILELPMELLDMLNHLKYKIVLEVNLLIVDWEREQVAGQALVAAEEAHGAGQPRGAWGWVAREQHDGAGEQRRGQDGQPKDQGRASKAGAIRESVEEEQRPYPEQKDRVGSG